MPFPPALDGIFPLNTFSGALLLFDRMKFPEGGEPDLLNTVLFPMSDGGVMLFLLVSLKLTGILFGLDLELSKFNPPNGNE